jgi:hypothetical protein
MLHLDGSGAVTTVGSDPGADMRPQLLVPGKHLTHLAPQEVRSRRLRPAGQHGVARGRAHGVEYRDIDALVGAYPDLCEEIHAFAG